MSRNGQRGEGLGRASPGRRGPGWRESILRGVLAASLLVSAGAAPAPAGLDAPEFELADLAGKPVRLSSLRGEVVVLHFWATWCPHCLTEMPVLARWQSGTKDSRIRVLAVNLGEPRKRIVRYLEKNRLDLTVLLDSKGTVAKRYGVAGLPATIVVDPSGKIAQHISMGTLEVDAIENLAASLLGGSPGTAAGKTAGEKHPP